MISINLCGPWYSKIVGLKGVRIVTLFTHVAFSSVIVFLLFKFGLDVYSDFGRNGSPHHRLQNIDWILHVETGICPKNTLTISETCFHTKLVVRRKHAKHKVLYKRCLKERQACTQNTFLIITIKFWHASRFCGEVSKFLQIESSCEKHHLCSIFVVTFSS